MKIRMRVLACFLLLTFVGSFCVAAQTEITGIEYTGSSIAVTATADGAAGTHVSFRVSKEGTNNVAGTVAILEQPLDSQHQTVFQFTIPETKGDVPTDGTYIVTVKAEQEEPDSESLVFVTLAQRDQVLQDLQGLKDEGKDSSDLGDLLTTDPDVRDALTVAGIAMDVYDDLEPSAKEAFLSGLFDQLQDCDDMTELKTLANNEMARAIINDGSAADVEGALSTANLTYDGIAYKDITDSALKAWIDEQIYGGRHYSDSKELDDRYQLVNIYYALNHARNTEVEGLLTGNSALLELDGTPVYRDYLSRLSGQGLQIDSEFVRLLSKNPVSSNEDVLDRLAQAIENVQPGDNNGSGGSGSGSGRGIQSNTTIGAASGTVDLNLLQLGKNFWDLGDVVWAAEAINALADRGILNGVGDGKFEPNRTVTREEFAKMLALACEYEISNEVTAFTDVSYGAWYAPYVSTLTRAGVIKGVSDDQFGVGMELSRQDMAVLLYRVLGGSLTTVRDWNAFSDYDAAAEYAKEAIRALYSAGCVDGMGDGTFCPAAPCTRAEAAKMLYQIVVK